MLQHPDIFTEFCRDIARRIKRAASVEAVLALMTDPFLRSLVNDLPPEMRDKLRAYGKDRCHELGWPRKVPDAAGEDDQRPPEELRGIMDEPDYKQGIRDYQANRHEPHYEIEQNETRLALWRHGYDAAQNETEDR